MCVLSYVLIETCPPSANHLKGLVFLPWDNFEKEEQCQDGTCRCVCALVWFVITREKRRAWKSVFLFPCPSLSSDLHCLTQVRALEAGRLTSPSFRTQREAPPSALGSGCVLISRFGSQGLLSSPRVWRVYSTIWSCSLMGLR